MYIKNEMKRKNIFITDLVDAINNRQIWLHLSWLDTKLKYRRSKIGQFWITLSMIIFISSLGLVYSKLFKANPSEYIPYLAISYIIWNYISGLLNESSNLLVNSTRYIGEIKINPIILILGLLTKHIIIFSHNILIVFLIYFFFKITPNSYILYSFPTFVLLTLNLFNISVFLSILGLRYRDMSQIVQNLIQVLFFITPITWFPKLLSSNKWIIDLNPMAHFIEIFRSPILGNSPPSNSIFFCLFILILLFISSSILYSWKVKRLVYWL